MSKKMIKMINPRLGGIYFILFLLTASLAWRYRGGIVVIRWLRIFRTRTELCNFEFVLRKDFRQTFRLTCRVMVREWIMMMLRCFYATCGYNRWVILRMFLWRLIFYLAFPGSLTCWHQMCLDGEKEWNGVRSHRRQYKFEVWSVEEFLVWLKDKQFFKNKWKWICI